MNQRIVGIAVAVGGAVLAWYGWQEKQGFGSQISEALSGSPSDRALWMLIGGGVLFVLGLAMAAGIGGKRR